MKKYRYVILLGGLLLICGGIYLFTAKNKSDIAYLTAPVIEMNIEESISATGEVVPVQLVTVGAQVSGQIEKLYVELGDQVKKGDLIAKIDSTTQQNEYEKESAKLISYEAQLESTNIELAIAKTQYEREEGLFKKNATSLSNVESAQKTLVELEAKLADLSSQIKQSRINLETAKVNLSYTEILSPLNGTIVSVPVEEGQTLNAAMSTPTIVQIAELNKMRILMEISEADVTKVNVGMPVTYTILSSPNETFSTTLQSIDPGLTTLTNGSYEQGGSANEAIYYYGRLEVDNDPEILRIGMTVQNSIEIGKAQNVLAVPSLAIYERNGRYYLKVLVNNSTEEREVVAGLSDGIQTEIISGITKKDQIIISEMNSMDFPDMSNMPKPSFM